MICKNCGADNEEYAGFCRECGAKIEKSRSMPDMFNMEDVSAGDDAGRDDIVSDYDASDAVSDDIVSDAVSDDVASTDIVSDDAVIDDIVSDEPADVVSYESSDGANVSRDNFNNRASSGSDKSRRLRLVSLAIIICCIMFLILGVFYKSQLQSMLHGTKTPNISTGNMPSGNTVNGQQSGYSQQPTTTTVQTPTSSTLTVGQRNVKFGKYAWRVLEVQGNKALLLSEDIIETRAYHDSGENVRWENCTLRQYLNGEFMKNFSNGEQSRIVESVNKNPDSQWFGTSGGNDTKDSIFLLSIDEIVKYFGDSGDLKSRKGWYWENEKYVLGDEQGYLINDGYNEVRIAKHNGEAGWWWLRSPGYDGSRAAGIDNAGIIGMSGGNFSNADGGIRPALWIKR